MAVYNSCLWFAAHTVIIFNEFPVIRSRGSLFNQTARFSFLLSKVILNSSKTDKQCTRGRRTPTGSQDSVQMKPIVYTLFSITIYFYDPRVQLLFFALLNSSMCAAMPQQQQMWWHRSGSQTKGCGCKDDRTEEKLTERTQRETLSFSRQRPESHRRVSAALRWQQLAADWSRLEPGTVMGAFLATITQRNTPRQTASLRRSRKCSSRRVYFV